MSFFGVFFLWILNNPVLIFKGYFKTSIYGACSSLCNFRISLRKLFNYILSSFWWQARRCGTQTNQTLGLNTSEGWLKS